MKNKVIISSVYVVLGALIILAPTVIFPVCAAEMKMRCTYTGQAAIGLGGLLILLGLISPFFDEKVRAGISIAIIGVGTLTITYPVKLIGVCGNSMMTCDAATRPLLIVLGILTILVSVINVLDLLKSKEVKN